MEPKVFRQVKLRVDTSNIYIRNAIVNPSNKPLGNQVDWSEPVLNEISGLQSLINQFHPVFIFCFGPFSYEFTRRVLKESPNHAHGYWGAKRLGEDFTKRVAGFECGKTNIFPLLHVSIARGKFIQSHDYYCNKKGANYFEYVGSQIADILLAHKDELRIWI